MRAAAAAAGSAVGQALSECADGVQAAATAILGVGLLADTSGAEVPELLVQEAWARVD